MLSLNTADFTGYLSHMKILTAGKFKYPFSPEVQLLKFAQVSVDAGCLFNKAPVFTDPLQ
jgi:hypothetical protein